MGSSADFDAAYVATVTEELRKARERIEEITETYTDEHGAVWNTPTSYAYAKACRALAHHRDESERLTRRLELIEGRRFPIMGGGPNIPWVIIAPYESQAQSNHGQSLERLAQRGGLDIGEAIAIMTGKSWREIRRDITIDEFNAFVAERMRAYGAQT